MSETARRSWLRMSSVIAGSPAPTRNLRVFGVCAATSSTPPSPRITGAHQNGLLSYVEASVVSVAGCIGEPTDIGRDWDEAGS